MNILDNREQLRTNNTTLTEQVLSMVRNLPEVGGGGEDITAETNEYTSLLAEALVAIQGKAGIGGGSGQYVWKKCETYHNISISMNLPSTAAVVLTVSCDSVDLTKVDVNFFAGYRGLVTVHGYECPFEFLENGKALFTWDGTVYEKNVVYTPSTKTMTIDDNWSGVFTKTFTKEPTLVDYVVSDDANAYPSGAEKDSYWYEKVTSGIPAKAFNRTKFAVDKITFSTAMPQSTSLSHSLGSIPTAVFLIGADSPTTSTYEIKHVMITLEGNEKVGAVIYNGGSGGMVASSVDKINDLTLTANSFVLDIYNTGTTGSAIRYKAGLEYTLITMA